MNLELNTSQCPIDDSSSSSSNDDDNESRSKSTSPNSSSHNDNGNKNPDRDISKAFIEREERHVRRVRYTLAAAILMCASVVSGTVYMFAHKEERGSFEREVSYFTYFITRWSYQLW
jgi:hypothetical protein